MQNKWWVRLELNNGKPSLIEEYAKYLGIKVDKREDGFFISSVEFDKYHDHNDLFNYVEPFLKKIQGFIFIQEGFSIPLSFDLIEKKEENGTSSCYMQSSEVINMRARVSMQVLVNGQPVEDINDQKLMKYGHIMKKNEAVEKVLTLMSEPTYMNMYKVIELLTESYGGEASLVNTGIISKGKLKQLKQNLNHPGLSGEKARHIKSHGNVSKDMYLPEEQLRNEMSQFIKRWMDSLH